MKRTILFLFSLALATLAFSQTKSKGGLFGSVKDALSKPKGGTSSLSNDEIIAGLKEALGRCHQ
jgi:hypothetical protein